MKGNPAKCTAANKDLWATLQDSNSKDYSAVESVQGSDKEGSHPAEDQPSLEDERDD